MRVFTKIENWILIFEYKPILLTSGEFVARLSGANQQLCRRVDTVVFVGKREATALYTWDFWTGEDMRSNHPLSPLSSLASVTPYEYCAKFEDGERAYEAGDWTRATSRLFECQKLLPGDHPAGVLIANMSRSNNEILVLFKKLLCFVAVSFPLLFLFFDANAFLTCLACWWLRCNFNAPVDWAGARHLTDK